MKPRLLILNSMLLAAGVSLFSATAAPLAPATARVDSLLAKMTVDEKVGQLNQLSGYGYVPEMVERIRTGAVGSLLNEVDPVVVNRLQKVAVDSTRLGIPLIFARDVIHGFKTIFPIPLGQAATWDAAIVREGARVAADEGASVGVRWTFSPMVDIARDARWGRIAEGFGEDPYLASVLGKAMVEGYQGDDLTAPNTMAACVKHFAGYGAAEGGRDYNTTFIPENHLRDVYLPPFKTSADAGAATFMVSFNDINGVPSSGNAHLLRDILRGEWGWDGLVVSDWGSIQQMIPHGFSTDLRHAAQQGAEAGVDVDMESYAYIGHLKDLVEKGEVSMETLDEMVRNVLVLKERLGLFDNPYVDLDNASRFFTDGNLAAARNAAAQSAILLKNDNGVLPLAEKPGKIAVAGPMADAMHDQNGTWSFDMEKTRTVTPMASLKEKYGDKNIIDAVGLTFSRDRDESKIKKAVKAASKSDVILYFAGEEAVLSGEAHCRTDLRLPGAQAAEIAALKATGKPVVVVVMAGRPLEISEQSRIADGIVYWFHPGTMGGPAIVDVLTGSVNPAGHLPVSLPKTSGQMPLYYSHKNTGRPAEGITLIDDIELEAGQTSTGCTSYYLDAGDGPLYPFGYGGSYTTFSYSDPVLSSAEMTADGSLTVSCTVTNTGQREGSTVPQMYIRDLVSSLVRPVRELRGFEKISLAPGESKEVSFTIKSDDLKYHNARLEYVAEPGDFNVWISPDAQSGSPATFTLK